MSEEKDPAARIAALLKSKAAIAGAAIVVVLLAIGYFWWSGTAPAPGPIKVLRVARVKKTTRRRRETTVAIEASATAATETPAPVWGRTRRRTLAASAPAPSLDTFVGNWLVIGSPASQNLDNTVFQLARAGDFIVGQSGRTSRTMTLKLQGASLSGWYITSSKAVLPVTAALSAGNTRLTITARLTDSSSMVYQARRQ